MKRAGMRVMAIQRGAWNEVRASSMEPQCAEARCRRVNEQLDPAESHYVRRVLIVIAIAAGVLLLWELRQVVVLLFGAVMVATVFRAISDMLEKHLRLPERIAVLLSVLIIVGIIGGVVWSVGSQIGAQSQNLAATLPRCRARRRLSTTGWRGWAWATRSQPGCAIFARAGSSARTSRVCCHPSL